MRSYWSSSLPNPLDGFLLYFCHNIKNMTYIIYIYYADKENAIVFHVMSLCM